MWKKSGGIEVIREVKYFRIDTKSNKKEIKFSAYYNNNSSVSPSKSNSTESYFLLEPIQIPPAINRIPLPSQSTAPEESLAPIFVASKQGLDASA
nr:hypothetical protein [uncultured Anaerobutyricum sp.]